MYTKEILRYLLRLFRTEIDFRRGNTVSNYFIFFALAPGVAPRIFGLPEVP